MTILGTYSPTSEIGGRVIWTGGVSPSVMAGTHGYGFGCILIEDGEDNTHVPADVRGRQDSD